MKTFDDFTARKECNMALPLTVNVIQVFCVQWCDVDIVVVTTIKV